MFRNSVSQPECNGMVGKAGKLRKFTPGMQIPTPSDPSRPNSNLAGLKCSIFFENKLKLPSTPRTPRTPLTPRPTAETGATRPVGSGTRGRINTPLRKPTGKSGDLDAQATHTEVHKPKQPTSPPQDVIKVLPKTIQLDKKLGMTYKKGGGFAAIKQLAVASLGEKVQDQDSQSLLTSRQVRIPVFSKGKNREDPRSTIKNTGGSDGRKQTEMLESSDEISKHDRDSSSVKGFFREYLTRVPSNEWLNDRKDLKRIVFATDNVDVISRKAGIRFLREEEERVATAKSGTSSSRPASSSQGPGGSALDKEVNELEKRINYLFPKPLLPEVYQNVITISNIVPKRPHTPRLVIRPPTVPQWNPSSPQSPARKIAYEDRLPLIASAVKDREKWPIERLPYIQKRLAKLKASSVTAETAREIKELEMEQQEILVGRDKHDCCASHAEKLHEEGTHVHSNTKSHTHNFSARPPRSPMKLSVGFERGTLERYGERQGDNACKMGREVVIDIEGLETNVFASKSYKESAGMPRYSLHQSPREKRLVTNNPPIGAGFATTPSVEATGRLATTHKVLLTSSEGLLETSSFVSVSSLVTTKTVVQHHDDKLFASSKWNDTLANTRGEDDTLALNSTTSFVVHNSFEMRDTVVKCKSILARETFTKNAVFTARGNQKEQHPPEIYTYVRPSLRPAAAYRALDLEYDYANLAKEAAFARTRQRQAYQDALLNNTSATAALVLKGVVNVVGEIIRLRELARLKREAEERARLALDKFERECIELVIVRVIKAIDIPVDERIGKNGPAPYVWVTTRPKDKKRGARKETSLLPKTAGSGFFAALKKVAGAVGILSEGMQDKILTEAFTEVGCGVTHVWDEEFTLLVDKVGDRVLRLEAVDHHLKFGKDSLGSATIPVESLALGKPATNEEGLLYRAVGPETQQWVELSERKITREEEEVEMIITLVEAKGLAAADKGGTSDPYCTLELEKLGRQDVQKFRSRTEHKTLDPAWGQAFKFNLGTYEQVFEHDSVSLKDAATKMLSMVHREDVFKDIAQKGVAALAAVADEEHEKAEENKKLLGDAQAPAILLINVLKAKNLMSADSGGTSDPYVRIHVGSEIANGKKTKVIKKTLNPEWNEHFEIQIREKQRKDMITIEVFDKDVIGKDDSLGKISIALETLALKYTPSEELLTKWHAFDAEDGILNNGQVLLSYDLVKRSSGQTAVSKKKADLFRTITLNIWDYDMGGFGTDDFLGQLKLPLNLLEPDKTCDKWFDLEPRLGCKGRALPVTGQVHLRIMCRFKNREKDRTMPAKPAQVLLQLQRVRALKETRPTELAVTLVSAKNLHLRLDTDEKPDSMAVVSVDGRKFASDLVKCEQNPGWYSSFSFDTIRLESKLHVALFDIMGKQRRFLGKVEYDSSKLQIGELREETLKLRKGFREPEDNSASPYKDLQVIVHLREAKDLLAADRGGTSDPYATLQIDKQEYKSKVQRKTLKPKWRETFRFQLGSYPKSRSEETTAKNRKLWKKARKKKMGVDTSVTMTRPGSAQTNKTTNTMVTSFSEILKGVKKYLTVSIWDHDMGPNPDDFLGCVVLPMDLVTDGDEFEDWFELRPGEDKAQVTGMVKLGIKITEKWDPEPVEGSVTLRFERIPKDVTKEEIVIEVVQARDIQAADRGGTSDPFAIVSFEGPGIVNASTVKTRVIPKTLTPVWEELFVLNKERGAKNLVVDVFDHDRFGSNDFLGRVFLPITTITEDYTEQWLELVEKTGDRPSTGEITGQVQLKFKRRPQGSVMPEEIDLHVIEAMNLMAADRGGTSDPFAVIGLKGSSRMPNTFKTRVVSKNLNPVWNERFTLNIQESDKSLILDVFDEDILGSNDFLGRIKLPLSDIVNGQPVQAWYPLSSMNEELLEESEELVIEVIEAKGIKAADRGGTSDPFAILSFNGGSKRLSSQKTKTIHKTLEPVWNESFTTSLDSHPHELCVDIFDYDLVGMNDFLGRVNVSINLIEHNSTVQQWFELGYKNDPNTKEVGLGDGRSRGGKEQTSKTLASAATAVTCLPENSDGNEPSDNDESQIKIKNKDILTSLSNTMHGLLERVQDFLRGPEGGITGSVHLKITRRPRDLGSVHMKIFRRNCEPFTRVVVVELLSGRNFLGADKSGDSDPYVTFIAEGSADEKRKLKSKVIDNNNLNPEWNQAFRFAMRGDHFGQLRVEVFDHNKMSKHQCLGVAAVDLGFLLESQDNIFDEWVPLTGHNNKLGAATGDVRLRISMEIEEMKPPSPPPPARKVQVVVSEARNLVAADRGGTSDPFAVAQIAGLRAVKTKVVKKTLDPKWGETLVLKVPSGNTEPLRVQVYDHDQFGSNDFLGEIIIPLDVMDVGQVVDKWYDLEPRQGKDDEVSGGIHLQIVMTEEDEGQF